jgi:hypothetical protein
MVNRENISQIERKSAEIPELERFSKAGGFKLRSKLLNVQGLVQTIEPRKQEYAGDNHDRYQVKGTTPYSIILPLKLIWSSLSSYVV